MRKSINQLKDNEQLNEVYQLTDIQLRPNKNGNLYIQFSISDKTGTLGGRIWNATDELYHHFAVNDYVSVEGTVQRFQGQLQLIVKKMSVVDPETVDPEDFRRFRPIQTDQLQVRLKELLRSIKNPDLMNLCDCILLDEKIMSKIVAAPAGIKLHHAYPGGLLEHSVTMMEVADRIAPLYPMLDRDFLLVGAFLHDIGKIDELSFGNEMSYTDEGQMLGHPFLGVEILHDKIRDAEKLSGQRFDPETVMLLKHLLISHHGTLENGSSKVPMTLEALALHFIDSLDAKVAEFQKHIFEDPSAGGTWTNYIPAIERKLYKGKNQKSDVNV